MTTKTDNQQLAFHAWLSRRGIASNYAGDGQYEEPRVQLAWEAWTTAVDEMRPRAAVEADRQGRMPSDDEIIAEFANAQTSDGNADNAWTLYPDELIQAVRTLLSRYGSGQPKPSNSTELKQPAASAEPAVWVAADTLYSAHPTCISSLAYMSQIDHDRGREYVPLAIINHHASPVAQEPLMPWRGHWGAIDAKALSTAQEIALMWGADRSQFVSRIQIAVIEAMLWMQDGVAAPVAARAQPSAQAKCQTCGGRGWVGGPSYYTPDEGGEPCPDCAQDREDAIPDSDAVDLAREGMELHKPGQPEYIVCAELVRVAARAAKGADHG
ncbi:hypothetical protein [Castellaniella sp.]|uniref:hypothetical protein n=1 Tax=Castellaniella sp. TaxID=1955812 RepID=UPI002AFEE2AD|nr:hypothetical protein [Castellaniella sp.]